MRSANHHYIPKAILRGFCFEPERIWYHNKRFSNEIEPRNIKSIFRRRHLNTFTDNQGNKSDVLESVFARHIDDKINNFTSNLKSFLEEETEEPFRNEIKSDFILFFYSHLKRTPDFHEPLLEETFGKVTSEESLKRIIEEHGPFSDESIRFALTSEELSRTKQNARVQALASHSHRIFSILDRMSICVAKPKSIRKTFIVGSLPIARFHNHPDAKLGEGGVELWTTLTKDLAVGFCDPTDHRKLFLDDSLVRKINTQIFKNSTCVGSYSEKLIQSLLAAR